MEPIITINNLHHQYGENVSLEGINLSVHKGEIFGLLGPNGTGKTTTIRLLNGLLKPFSGNIRVMGYDPQVEGEKI